jgi:hypothetical protein
MIHPSCLPLPADQLLNSGGNVATLILVSMLLALMISALLAPLMRRMYRQKVARLMAMNHLVPPSTLPAAQAGELHQGVHHSFDAGRLCTLAEQGEQRIRRATLLAGLMFMTMALLIPVLNQLPASDVVGFVILAAPLAAGIAHNNWPSRQPWRARGVTWVALALAGLVCVNEWPDSRQEAENMNEAEAVMFGLACGTAYFVSFHRSLRGQVLPLVCMTGMPLLITFALNILAEQQLGTCWQSLASAETGVLAGSSRHLLMMLPTLLGTWAGLRLLVHLAGWVDKGWLSEVSLVSSYTLLIWTTCLCVSLEQHPAWTALMLLAWVGATVGAYVLALGPKPHAGPAPQLLMLRVFSNDTRHHDLLDVVQGRWRLLGPVHQIGGPDMVAMNVDPHEAMKFLTNRLHELFLPTGIGLADLQARLSTQPDKEGRFRINEVFCFNTAWQATVVQLMQLSDVVLLDVRGMSDNRHGTGFEIDQLASRGLLRRVLAVGNAQTNWLHVDELVRKAGQQPAMLQRVREDELVGDELFRRLCECAAWTADEGQVVKDAVGLEERFVSTQRC